MSPSYVVGRKTSALLNPRVEDVHDEVADLLPAFTGDTLRASFRGPRVEVILGALRARERFPASSRFRTAELLSWEQRTKVTMAAPDAFGLLGDPRFESLMPYAVLPVAAFGPPLRSVIVELQTRVQVDPYGFALLWIGSGGHVTPLHHDGPMVHGRWHLVVRGRKQFDLVPPRSRKVPRQRRWDLYRRFSPLYKAPLPEAWFSDGTGAHRFSLEPGQMVTWGRRWWHRVEIASTGVTIGLSTRGLRPEELRRPRGRVYRIGVRWLGDAEDVLEAAGEAPSCTLEDLRALL